MTGHVLNRHLDCMRDSFTMTYRHAVVEAVLESGFRSSYDPSKNDVSKAEQIRRALEYTHHSFLCEIELDRTRFGTYNITVWREAQPFWGEQLRVSPSEDGSIFAVSRIGK